MKTAIYAFSGDPITNGHIDIIKRALQYFDHIIVGIGVNPKKKYAFNLQARLHMAREALKVLGFRVTVESFEGLLVDFAYSKRVKTLIRGIRNEADAVFEKEMFHVNLTQKGIEVICLFSKPSHTHISSSAVKEILRNQGNVIDYVPLNVKQALEVELLNQIVIGITGEIGAGKTYIANKMCELYGKHGAHGECDRPIYNIDLDVIARSLLTEDDRPFAVGMRELLLEKLFFKGCQTSGGFIDPKAISSVIFKKENAEAMDFYNEVTKEAILFEVYQQMRGKEGIILINSALLAEAHITPICNNHVIMIQAPDALRIERLHKRGYSTEEIVKRNSAQLSLVAKTQAITESIDETYFGQIFNFCNDESVDDWCILDFIRNVVKSIRVNG